MSLVFCPACADGRDVLPPVPLTPASIVGWDALNIEDIYTYLYRHRFYRGGEVLMSAMSGVDIALW